MDPFYFLQDVSLNARQNPRHFTVLTDEEIRALKVGEMVRLFFGFYFKADDGCQCERMWVEISEIDGEGFKGYLTNIPVYITDLVPGDLISFEKQHIASIILPPWKDGEKMAIITLRALEAREVNWLLRVEPGADLRDSGWQLFHGDEDDVYMENSGNATIIPLEQVLEFEPLLESAFQSGHNAFEWSQAEQRFVEVHDY
jgi:hypothetical protein